MRTRLKFCLMIVPLLLSACESGAIQESLGLNRDAPDEFTVVSRPPLSVPPEFDLAPPRPGEPPRGLSAEERARGLLSNGAVTPVQASDGLSGSASSLLKRAGADGADDAIRQKLGEDALKPVDTSKAKTLMDKITGAEKKEPTVDAKKEAERLRANKAAGKPVNEGDVPEEKPKSDSLIDRIF